MPLSPDQLQHVLQILSPQRPAQLSMRTALGDTAAQLRGGKQPAAQLLSQLKGVPGVKQGALTQAFGHVDPALKLTPQEFASQAQSPKLFAQRGAKHGDELDYLQMQELAHDTLWSNRLRDERARVMHQVLKDALSRYDDIDPLDFKLPHVSDATARADFERLKALVAVEPDQLTPEHIAELDGPVSVGRSFGDSFYMDDFMDAVYESLTDIARDMAEDRFRLEGAARSVWAPHYEDYQRQVPGISSLALPGSYFETILRGTPGLGGRRGLPNPKLDQSPVPSQYHFDNPAQLGHMRGAVLKDNSLLIDELQSDPLEVYSAKQVPELEGIYGKLGRMAIDRAAAAGLEGVRIPDANRIASVRGQRQLPFFRDVYDKALGKELYEPLAARGVSPRYEDGYWNISLDDLVRQAIKDQGLLNYRRGGLVQYASHHGA